MQSQIQQRNSLMKSLPIVAAALGKKHGINVVINRQSSTAATDGKTIYLPPIPDTDEASVLARGFIDHESAHIRFTDFETPWPKGVGKALFTILEDIRIEQLLGRELPGCRINLEALEDYFVNNGMYDVVDIDSHPHSILIARVHHCLRVSVLSNTCTTALADNAMAVYKSVLPAQVTDQIDQLLSQADQIRDTAHAAEISNAIVEIIRAADPEEPDQPPENPEAKDDQSQNDGDDSDEGNSDDQDQDESGDSSNQDDAGIESDADSGSSSNGSDPDGSDETDSKPNSGKNGDGEGDDESDGDSDGQAADTSDDASSKAHSKGTKAGEEGGSASENVDGRGGNKPGNQSASALKALQESLDTEIGSTDLGDKLAKKLEELSFTASMNGEKVVTMPLIQAHVSSPTQSLDSSEVLAETNALRTRLKGLIQASKIKRTPPRRHGSRVDTRSLHKLATSDNRIFRGREDKKAVNTAIVVLIDQSSSMNQLSLLTTKCAMAISLALDSIPDVQLAIGGFCSNHKPGDVSGTAHVAPMKLFNQRTDRNCFVPRASGGTPLTEGLIWTASELLSLNKVTRRIVIVLTDGQPADPVSSVDFIQKMKLASIETYGIGIKHVISPALIPKSSTITSIEQLAPAVFDLLQGILVGE